MAEGVEVGLVMAQETPCQTPGATYHILIEDQAITVGVDLPQPLSLSEDQARLLEANLHNAVELALAPLFAQLLSPERGRG